MGKLLKAGLYRLKKEKLFWAFIVVSILVAVYVLTMLKVSTLDSIINDYLYFIGLMIAIFVSIFVGKEHAEGLIRNKLIVGHSRANIYLSNLIISIVVSLLCELIYIAIVLIVGTQTIGNVQMPLSEFGLKMLNTTLIIIAFCSIYNFIAMVCSDITVATTICTLGFIALFIINIATESALRSSAPTVKHSIIDNNGVVIGYKEYPNENYGGEVKYNLIKAMYLLNPESQSYEVIGNDNEYTKEMPFYSGTLIIVTSALGIYVFSKKQLK